MAELLVMMPNVVPHKDGPGAWKAGMPVDVFPDGQLGPGLQQHPKFFIVRIPGATEDECREFLEDVSEESQAYMGIDPETGDPIMEPRHNMIHRRKSTLDFDNIPQPHRGKIDTERELTVANIAALRAWLKDTGN